MESAAAWRIRPVPPPLVGIRHIVTKVEHGDRPLWSLLATAAECPVVHPKLPSTNVS